MRSQSGSVLLESAVVSVALSALISGGSLVLYVAFARVWIERQAYEAVVCLASLANASSCERDFRNRVNAALPIGRLSRVQIARTVRSASVVAIFHVAQREIAHARETRRLPLDAGVP